jgi:sugar phosphate permease
VILGGFGGYVADNQDLGWRFAFHLAGIVGLLYALPLGLLLREPPRRNDTDAAPNEGVLSSLLHLLRSPAFLLLVACFTLPALAGWVVRDWMPAILKQQFNLGQGAAGVSATLYWNLAALLGVFVGGWLADRWARTQPRGRMFVSAMGITMLAPALFGVGNAGSLGIAVAFLVLFGLGWGMFDCNNMPILCQITRPNLRATGYGLMNFVSISCGGLADWGFGRLRDAQVPLNGIFAAFAGLALASALLMLCIRPARSMAQQALDDR